MRSRYPGEQPGKDAAALDERQQRPTKKISDETIPNTAATIKKLLKHRNNAWLFEVSEGHRVQYVVENNSECWRFALRFQVESKFEHLLAKTGGGAR